MKFPLNILLIQILIASCSNQQSKEVGKSETVATKAVTEYLNGNKIHYREYDSLDNVLLHIYFNEPNKVEKTLYSYDIKGNLLAEKRFLNDSLLENVEFSYQFDKKLRPTRISKISGNRLESTFITYENSNDTLVKTYFQSEKDYKELKWLKKTYEDKDGKWIRLHYNKIYGGGADGEQIINHYNGIGKMDYQVHFYMGFDTTFFQYDIQNHLIKTSGKQRDREEYGDFEYDKEGNKIKWTITEIIYYQGDTLRSTWTYDWKKL